MVFVFKVLYHKLFSTSNPHSLGEPNDVFRTELYCTFQYLFFSSSFFFLFYCFFLNFCFLFFSFSRIPHSTITHFLGVLLYLYFQEFSSIHLLSLSPLVSTVSDSVDKRGLTLSCSPSYRLSYRICRRLSFPATLGGVSYGKR